MKTEPAPATPATPMVSLVAWNPGRWGGGEAAEAGLAQSPRPSVPGQREDTGALGWCLCSSGGLQVRTALYLHLQASLLQRCPTCAFRQGTDASPPEPHSLGLGTQHPLPSVMAAHFTLCVLSQIGRAECTTEDSEIGPRLSKTDVTLPRRGLPRGAGGDGGEKAPL